MSDDGIRINKYLSEHGICSRRKADEEIAAGHVMINGATAGMGDRVHDGDEVSFGGHIVGGKDKPVILLVNKPEGIVCTAEKREKNNIVDFIDYPVRLFPVGRLDKDSSGLILMTNQGDLVNRMMRAANYHEKEYIVKVNKPITGEFLKGMSEGVPLRELKTITRPCKVKKLGPYTFSIVLTQGLNRQIRRMCSFFDYRVRTLKRVRIMNLVLDDIQPGTYREITAEEEKVLMQLLSSSDNTPAAERKHGSKTANRRTYSNHTKA